MIFDAPPPPKLWLPPKPAIIRAWKEDIACPDAKGVFPFPTFMPSGAAAPVATVSRDYAQATGTTGLTPSIASVPFNTAHANRIIVFGFGWNGSLTTFGSATIAGVAVTLVCNGSAFASGLRFVIFYAAVPTGTSGTVAITLVGGAPTAHTGVSWSVVYANSGTHIAAAITTAAAGANISVNVNTLSNSVVCGLGRGLQARTASGIMANYSNFTSSYHVGQNSLIAAATPAAAGLNNAGSQVTAFGAVTFS